MKKRVLVLAPSNDFHANAIGTLLKKHDAEADIIDTAHFPLEMILSQYGAGFESVYLDRKRLADYHSIWWRRPNAPVPSSEIKDPEEFRFASRECREALWGAIHASGLPIYNEPQAEQVAVYKPYQLKLAHACGLNIPETLVTNDPEEVRAFRVRHEQVVYKAFSGTTLMMTDTRPLSGADEEELWRLKFAPVIFQEYLPLGREYRVALIEDEVIATEIQLRNPKAHFDWRLDQNYQVLPARLPDALCSRLLALRRKLRLNSGSVDLRETPDGKIYFLEINPSGQFLFLDIFAGTDVGNAFCRMLLRQRG